jgi:cytochrome c
MDSFELNKILGAVLGTCLILLSLNIASGALFSAHNPEKPGYEIAVKEEPAGGAAAEKPAPEVPLPVRFASADAKRGQNDTKPCLACHTFGKGEPNRVGPNLFGVVGRPKHSEAGFNYSAAMKKQEGNWKPEDLDKFLTNPRADIPGTLMTFAGLSRGQARADVITYLNSNSDKPIELPKQAAAPAADKQAADQKGGDKPQAAPDQKGGEKPQAAPAETKH